MPDSSAHDPVANAETTLQQQIRLALGTCPDARIFRNQVGSLPDPRSGRLVTFGLARGSAYHPDMHWVHNGDSQFGTKGRILQVRKTP